MERYSDCPLILREFLSYHESIKGQSKRTISEYHLDLRMFLRFMKLIKLEMPYDTDLETISIRDLDLPFIRSITVTDVFDFLSFILFHDDFIGNAVRDALHRTYCRDDVIGLLDYGI